MPCRPRLAIEWMRLQLAHITKERLTLSQMHSLLTGSRQKWHGKLPDFQVLVSLLKSDRLVRIKFRQTFDRRTCSGRQLAH